MKWPSKSEFDIESHTILAGYMGSHSHGTYIAPKDGGIDDKDIMGIVIPPRDYLLGLKTFNHLCCWEEEYDLTFYELKKYVNLVLKANPNVMGMLWLLENYYVKRTKAGNLLIKNREIFSSKKIYKSFIGYAYSQFSEMYRYKGNGFLASKRKESIDKFGYDVKNAAHLVRLLRMGIEFLCTGELNVHRPDAPQLIRIKQGEYAIQDIEKISNDLIAMSQEALIKSTLPNEPDYEKANQLILEVIDCFEKERK